MSELAFNMNGEPFEVPATATGWRVRRMKHKGAPEVVYSRDGMPLVLPIDASVEDLRAAVGAVGRYRVDPVDGHRPIPNAAAGYVFVHDGDAPISFASGPCAPRAELPPASDSIVIEAMRMNADIARTNADLTKTMVEKFPHMMEAAATLLRAADGAGLPARPPLAAPGEDDEDTDDDGEDEQAANGMASLLDLVQPMVGPAVQYLVTGLISGQVKLPSNLGEMFDWRKAAANGKNAATDVAPADAPPAEPATEAPTTAPSSSEPPRLNLQDAAHFVAIQNALAPEEAAFARQAASNLSPAEVAAWMAKLAQLSVPDAVTEIRKEIAKANAVEGAQ